MKARIPLRHRVTKKQYDTAAELAHEAVRKERGEMIRRIFKITVYALHELYGIGCERGYRLLNMVEDLADEQKQDEVFWWHMDHEVKKLGYNFENEDYEVMDR